MILYLHWQPQGPLFKYVYHMVDKRGINEVIIDNMCILIYVDFLHVAKKHSSACEISIVV